MHKDIVSKEVVLAITQDIAYHLLKLDIKDIDFVDKELKRIEKREVDIVAKCKINNQTQILHLEIQSTNDATMPRRMLRYYIDIKERFKKLYVNQYVIYTGKAKCSMDNFIVEHNLNYNYHIIDMHDIDCEHLIQLDTPNALVLSVLCDFQGKKELDVLLRLVKRLKALTHDNEHEFGKYLLMLETLSDNRDLKQQLKEVQAMLRETSYKNLPSYEIGMERGVQQGMQQVAKNLLDILDNETIASKTGLSIEMVKSLRASEH